MFPRPTSTDLHHCKRHDMRMLEWIGDSAYLTLTCSGHDIIPHASLLSVRVLKSKNGNKALNSLTTIKLNAIYPTKMAEKIAAEPANTRIHMKYVWGTVFETDAIWLMLNRVQVCSASIHSKAVSPPFPFPIWVRLPSSCSPSLSWPSQLRLPSPLDLISDHPPPTPQLFRGLHIHVIAAIPNSIFIISITRATMPTKNQLFLPRKNDDPIGHSS